ncbi:hypothetical protein BGX24_001343, partial [Mortierella sp. AD032]
WNPFVPMEFVTRSDGSVRLWRMSYDDDGNVVVNMLWGTNLCILHIKGLVFENAIDLSPVNQKLLVQRGAISPHNESEEQQ